MIFWKIFLLITGIVLLFIIIKNLNNPDELDNNSGLEKIEERNRLQKVTSINQNSSIGFWHGQKGLALTFWGFFVGGNILFNAATIIFADNSTLIITNLIFFVIWNVLAVMGVFNATNIYKAEKIKKGLPYTPATAAKVAVVLIILSGIGNSIPR
jgi:hypothetical protein